MTPGRAKVNNRNVLERELRQNFKKARNREKSILKKRPRLFPLSNQNDLGKRSALVVMRKVKKPIEKEIQKSKVRVFTYESQLGLTKLKSKRFVSGCGKQCKLLWKFPRNTILFCGVRNIGVRGKNYERYLWLRRLGA